MSANNLKLYDVFLLINLHVFELQSAIPFAFFFLIDQIKSLQFTSWWVENGEKNNIVIVFRLDGQPHEIIIKDTKYYVKELYSADKRNTT